MGYRLISLDEENLDQSRSAGASPECEQHLIVALQRDCVDLENGIIRIRRSFCKVTKLVLPTTKSGRNRILGINPGLKATLQKELQRHESQFVFCDPKGTPLTHHEIRHPFDRDQKLNEMRRISFHDLRHTFASHFVMKGGSIYDLKELLGHSDVATSMRYAHPAPSHLKALASLVQFRPNVPGKVVEMVSPKHFPNIGGEICGKTEFLTTGKNPNKVVGSAT